MSRKESEKLVEAFPDLKGLKLLRNHIFSRTTETISIMLFNNFDTSKLHIDCLARNKSIKNAIGKRFSKQTNKKTGGFSLINVIKK